MNNYEERKYTIRSTFSEKAFREMAEETANGGNLVAMDKRGLSREYCYIYGYLRALLQIGVITYEEYENYLKNA